MPTHIVPDQPVPNVMRARVAGTDGGTNVWNNLEYWKYTGGPPNVTDCQTFAALLLAQWKSHFLANLPPPYTVDSVTVTDLSSNTGAEAIDFSSSVGTSTADKLPGNVAVVINKQIDMRYRGGRPRSYMVVVADENLADPGHISTAYATTMLSNYNGWISGFIGESSGSTTIVDHVAVLFRGHFGPPPQAEYVVGTDKLIDPIVVTYQDYVVDLQLGSQRGRIGRRR